MTSPDGAKQNEYLEVTASLHVDGPLTPHVDEEWLEDPLRCPHCGNRARGMGGLWIDAYARLDGRSRPVVILAPDYANARIECTRCDYIGHYREFCPPWTPGSDQPCDCPDPFCAVEIPLTAADRAEEADWLETQNRQHNDVGPR